MWGWQLFFSFNLLLMGGDEQSDTNIPTDLSALLRLSTRQTPDSEQQQPLGSAVSSNTTKAIHEDTLPLAAILTRDTSNNFSLLPACLVPVTTV